MNFEELQLVWDAQAKQRLFAFDQAAMERLIDKQSRAIRLDLKRLEVSFVLAVLIMAVTATVETLWQRAEYFQLIGAAVGVAAAAWIWRGRRRRAAIEAAASSEGLAGEIELSIARTRAVIGRSRTFAIYFSVVIVCAVAVRVAVYGFEHSEVKVFLGAVALAFVNGLLFWDRRNVQCPRLKNLKALLAKLRE